jgi:4-amino-4-deoxy-L-arabinose transferase-like glycosyltransferase
MTSFDESTPFAFPDAAASRPAAFGAALDRGARLARLAPWAVCLIIAAAAALRFAELDDVQGNLFYDAAVRSMTMSWHNFFYGAFDPAGFLSVDKAPLDLWLQVVSVKLFGWNAAALKLPEALGGTLAVPLLYDTVRRVSGRAAGLGAATVMAVLPESVLTSRSDTMDSVMMLLVIAALWLIVRSIQTGQRRFVVLGGVVLGLAWNVKLFEALIAAPGLFTVYLLGASGRWRRRIADAAMAVGALVVVGLSWAIAASISPGSHPYPIGSTDGSVWNVMFVFNGFGRVSNSAVIGKPGGPGWRRSSVAGVQIPSTRLSRRPTAPSAANAAASRRRSTSGCASGSPSRMPCSATSRCFTLATSKRWPRRSPRRSGSVRPRWPASRNGGGRFPGPRSS